MFRALLEVQMLKKVKVHPIWRDGHQNVQNTSIACSEHFWKLKFEKMHRVVAKNTFRNQRGSFGSQGAPKVGILARNTFGVGICKTRRVLKFWIMRCSKSARHCGAKRISNSKCAKRRRFGTLFEVEMLKKCMPLWCEAHVGVSMLKSPHVRTTCGR